MVDLVEPHAPVDRSHDLSQPLDRLSADERLKAGSDQLRGTIAESLLDRITGAVTAGDAKLMKFQGVYQQDDRDLRDERRRQKLEPAYQFMVRVRLPGGVCTSEQWLKFDELARAYGRDSLRITTRQTFQFHWILKRDLKPTLQGLHSVLLDTISACGDDARGVVASVNPHLSRLHAEVYALAKMASDRAIPRMRAYHEIWYGEERVAGSEPEEPFYGRTYMPRKFKVGFAIPPVNDIDVYTQDLGLVAIAGPEGLAGFNVLIGGGMGRTDQAPTTYPRLADEIGFVPVERLTATIDAVMSVQRDFGDRADRAHARFKYTIDDKGLDWVRREIEARQGFAFAPARPFQFETNGDAFGWAEGEDGRFHHTLFLEAGRIVNRPGRPIMDGLREIARVHPGGFRLTTNQNLVIADVAPGERARIDALLETYGLAATGAESALRLNSIACVALPTCGLAMAESERYLPTFLTKLEAILAARGLQAEPITVRISGCPNGCSRPYVAEIALTGRAPGKYNLYLGGGFHGQRLNKMDLENVGEAAILERLETVIDHFARERLDGERFGDFAIRAGYVAEVRAGREFNA
jgi:sulfite reductase (NADPH) hemoprotein beta-component